MVSTATGETAKLDEENKAIDDASPNAKLLESMFARIFECLKIICGFPLLVSNKI
jgi:hypothetical protein